MLTRRSFFAFLASIPDVARSVFAAVPRTATPVELLTTCIAGYRFSDGPAIESTLRAGDRLVLRREASNAFDPRAVAVTTSDGVRLGYLPRRLNAVPATLLDQRVALRAKIVAIRPAPAPPWERVRIRVALECVAGGSTVADFRTDGASRVESGL